MNVELFRIMKNIMVDYQAGDTHCDNDPKLQCDDCDWNYDTEDDSICMFGTIEAWVAQHEM